MAVLSAIQGAGSTVLSNLFITLPIPDATVQLSQHVFIVTGSNTGLGLESVRHLSRLGVGKIIMAVRDETKGRNAKKGVLSSTSRDESSIDIWHLDMADRSSIKDFAARAASLPRLDGVLANAGIMTTHFVVSEGCEQTLNVNVINTFLLYMLLVPKMRESAQMTGSPCRYVIPNSALHYLAPLSELQATDGGLLERLNVPEKADMAGRYNLSKLLVVFGVRELAERVKGSEKGQVIINTPNPSFCKSGLTKESADSTAFKVFEKALARSTEEGSRALVHGLLVGAESNGQYLTNCHIQSPSCHVTDKWGQQFQKSFFRELLSQIETAEPGITSHI